MRPANLFLSKPGVVKLGYYGLLSEECYSKEKMKVEGIGYCAPEVFEGGYNVKSDVWSLGVLLFKAMTGVFPYSGHCEEAIPKATDPFDILADSGIHSTELLDFLQKCLVKDVNERSSVSELMDVSASLQSDE